MMVNCWGRNNNTNILLFQIVDIISVGNVFNKIHLEIYGDINIQYE